MIQSIYDIKEFDELDSTNDYAKTCKGDRVVIWAWSQTAGKGRLGRSWNNHPGEALTFSVRLEPDIDAANASMITLVSAMAVRDAIGNKAAIKWPNDVVIDGKKVVGILTEMSAPEGKIEYVIPGIGVNVNVKDFEGEIKDKATSLYLEFGYEWNVRELLDKILVNFEKYYGIFLETQNMAGLKDSYNDNLVNMNQKVRVISDKPFEGVARGINDVGELLVDTGDECIAVRSGEVSVRGVYGYV